MKQILNAANVLASIAGTVAADTVTGGVGTAISGATSLNELLRRFLGKTPGINARIATDLQTELDRHHLTPDQKLLIAQMIEKAPLFPSEVMAAARRPDRICAAMLAKMTDPAHQSPVLQDAFARVVTPVLTRLLADTAMSDTLRPAFEDAVAESLAFIGEQVERLAAQFHDTAYKLGVQDTLVKEIARRYAPGSEGDFNAACLGIEDALQSYADRSRAPQLPHNTADQVDDVLARMDVLNAEGNLDAAAEALATARNEARDRIAEQTSGLMRLLDITVDQARLRNLPEDAAAALFERLMLDNPADPFNSLGALQDEWYVRGRDKGLTFDATVAIQLGEYSLTRAHTSYQRGAALNNLGAALQTLGARETDSARLELAVIAYSNALAECSRDLAPLDWAMTQNNLGNAMALLGEREQDPARLMNAVVAYGEALDVWTRDLEPLEWAAAQNNRGNALRILGVREPGTALLREAVASHREALKVWTLDVNPRGWAMAQNNLGNALRTLGARKAGTVWLEQAVTAYSEALKVWTREHLPLDWATAKNNLGNTLALLAARTPGTARLEHALACIVEAQEEWTQERVPLDWAFLQGNLANIEITLFEKTGNPDHVAKARSHVQAAREVFVAAGAEHYVGMADEQLTRIANLGNP